ncbi:hypothetical protein VMCG_02282 [Cytospora schulzeri]|uniref:Uncharacterized protein n=1 Tax=Cytospora schulzeri TaxID=448051 RepID=A0A423X127_9PEZI|nr:hypothetical protein VMCG_02282 [Valsa malicola]
MDALTNLRDLCPDWARRIDELSGQIEQRQQELAELAAQQQQQSERSSDGRTGSKKSLRKRGSTESLRPNDDCDEAHPNPAITPARTSPEHNKNPAQEARRASVASRGGIDKPQKGPGNGNGNVNGNNNGHSSSSPSTSERQTNQAVAVASAKARAAMRRTQLSRRRAAESFLSADGATPAKYRSRNLVIVYYDSYVQSFFEELVKFVSASRNLMRKAKMAARVAQIKRMAELEMPDDDDSESLGEEPRINGNGPARLVPPQPAPMALKPDTSNAGPGATIGESKENGVGEHKDLKVPAADDKPDERNGNGDSPAPIRAGQPYLGPVTAPGSNGNGNGNSNGHKPSSPAPRPTPAPVSARPSMTAGFSSFSGLGFGESQQQDVFDELDKGLEYVQSMCEHAAHQFLRDGDCADEIVKIKDRLNETKEKADREMERLLQQGDSNGALDSGTKEEAVRSRNYRPQSLKRDTLGVGFPAARARTSLGSVRLSTPKAESEKPAAEKEPIEGLLGQSSGLLEVDERAAIHDGPIQIDKGDGSAKDGALMLPGGCVVGALWPRRGRAARHPISQPRQP